MTKQPTHERVELARRMAARFATLVADVRDVGKTQISLSFCEQQALVDGFEALYAIACLGLPNDALAPEAEMTPEEAERSRAQLASLAIPGFHWPSDARREAFLQGFVVARDPKTPHDTLVVLADAEHAFADHPSKP